METSSENTSQQASFSADNRPLFEAPELHITAERGVLEAAAGAALADGAIHVFHQFRSKKSNGSRWAHVTASDVPFDWDANDDVLRPENDEVDVLSGTALTLPSTTDNGEDAVELFFVTSSARDDSTPREEVLGSSIRRGTRGPRRFTIQRARIDNISEMTEISDDPKAVDSNVERLGPVDIDDSNYPISDLATPSVIPHGDGWVMIALNFTSETDAEAVILRSTDRQHWTVEGPLTFDPSVDLPSDRPYAPRLATMTDTEDDKDYDVLLLTFRDAAPSYSFDEETTGYVVGHLDGATFRATAEFRVLDHGHSLTRPRILHGDVSVLFGLVSAQPVATAPIDWANCLSTPRALSLHDGKIYQDIVGASHAVQLFSDYALIWTGQLNAEKGSIMLSVRNQNDAEVLGITYTRDVISVTRDGETRSAQLDDSDSDTLTVFVDGPLAEVYADGGAATLTSSITTDVPIKDIQVTTADGAEVTMSMFTGGQQLQRAHAGLDSAEEQERLIAAAAQADRDIEDGLIDDLLDQD